MKKWTIGVIAAVMLLLIAAGCGSDKGTYQDESAVKVNVTSQPEAKSGIPLQLTVEITGLVTEEDTKVTFDIREETETDLPYLIDSTKQSPGHYEGTHTFDKPGKYVIYIHIYTGSDLHITKRTTFMVA